jgi:hypothetical protein
MPDRLGLDRPTFIGACSDVGAILVAWYDLTAVPSTYAAEVEAIGATWAG